MSQEIVVNQGEQGATTTRHEAQKIKPTASSNVLFLLWKVLEASPGIEPGCKDLQSSASPLRHEASPGRIHEPWAAFRIILDEAQ